MPFPNLFKKIQALQEFDIARETADIINENGEYIVSLLKGQLSRGKDGDGKNVTVFGRENYRDITVFYKERHGEGLGRETGFITNYMTGVFYQSIYVYASGRSFIFDSAVPYFNEILLQSGEKIMELDSVSLAKFSNDILKPELQLRFQAKVNGI